MAEVKIEATWRNALAEEFNKPYFEELVQTLRQLKTEGKTIYPPGQLIFNAFELTPFDKVRVVILGQDPYHNPGEAMGLSFSVPSGVAIPPSLRNIYKEINDDLGLPIPNHGELSAWASQGVFLLNAFLTVEKNRAASHRNIGWHTFTDAVIERLSAERDGLVFMLWGNFAREKKSLINIEKHLVLEAAHPSPLAKGAFFRCKHFSKANAYLSEKQQVEINWAIE
jgi:uracil-DNA glycosylase